nr:PREDICTED: alpha-glucosidase-like [Bemisia tabaci]
MTRITRVAISAILMFVLSIVEVESKHWFENTVIYQIYPRSFKDSDGDGTGDFRGIQEKLDYLHEVGFDLLWIQPFFKSPMVDFGYDIADYRQTEPVFGTLEDLKNLIDAIHIRGMRVIIDFIPNHTSDESEWFKKSLNREDPYTDFYVWKDSKPHAPGTPPVPPNNWLSLFGGSAWQWHEKRQQFYYRMFSPGQPDLNYRNPKVKEAMKDVIRFWLDFGVDGFRVDAVPVLFEDEELRNNPYVSSRVENSTDFGDQIPVYTFQRPENFELLHQWRLLIDDYSSRDGRKRLMTVEAYEPAEDLQRYFGNTTHRIAHFPLYFEFVNVNYLSDSNFLDKAIHAFIDKMPPHGIPSWVASNHDNSRLASRVDPEFAEAMLMVQLLLPGVAGIYYGEEIRMKDIYIRPDQKKDFVFTFHPTQAHFTRDVCRGPMQWDDSLNAGFSTSKTPWLPVNPDYWRNNVKKQLSKPRSTLNMVKRLLKLKKSPTIESGDLKTCKVSQWVYMFTRELKDEPPVVVILNLGTEMEPMCLNECKHFLQGIMKVHTASANSGYKSGDAVTILHDDSSQCSTLRPKAGLVLTSSDAISASRGTRVSLPLLISLMLILFIVPLGHHVEKPSC